MFTNAPLKTNNSPRIEWKSSGPATFKCSLDNAPYTLCGATLNTRGVWSRNYLSHGRHTLDIKAEDADGNEQDQKRHSWLVGKMKES